MLLCPPAVLCASFYILASGENLRMPFWFDWLENAEDEAAATRELLRKHDPLLCVMWAKLLSQLWRAKCETKKDAFCFALEVSNEIVTNAFLLFISLLSPPLS